MERLPMKVLLLIAQYNTERHFEHMGNASPVFVQENSDSPFHIFGKKYRVEYTIIGYEPLEKECVTEDSWKSYRRIQKGQTIAQSEDINIEQEFGFSSDFKLQNEDELSIGIDNLASFKASLALKMEHDLDVKYSEKRQQTVTRKLELKLLDDTSGIVSRDYEYAQAFRKVRVYLQRACTCCQSRTIDPITVFFPIPVLRFRIKENYSDGTTKVIPDGEILG